MLARMLSSAEDAPPKPDSPMVSTSNFATSKPDSPTRKMPGALVAKQPTGILKNGSSSSIRYASSSSLKDSAPTMPRETAHKPLVLTLLVGCDVPIGMRVKEDGGLLEITKLDEDGAGAQAGLELHDQLLAVDGMPLGGQARRMTELMFGKEMVQVTLSRPRRPLPSPSPPRPPPPNNVIDRILDTLSMPMRCTRVSCVPQPGGRGFPDRAYMDDDL